MFEIFYLFKPPYFTASAFNWAGLTGNCYLLIATGLFILYQLAFTYLAPMQFLFGSMANDLHIWLRILLVVSSVLFLVELEKSVVRRWERIK